MIPLRGMVSVANGTGLCYRCAGLIRVCQGTLHPGMSEPGREAIGGHVLSPLRVKNMRGLGYPRFPK